MKIACDREKLLAAFQTAAAVAPSRSPKPILQNVKMTVTDEGAILMATDLDVGIRISVLGIEVETGGSVVLPVGQFGSILRETADQTLCVEADSQGTVVRGERSEFHLPGMDPDEFPEVAGFTEETYYEVAAPLLKELIRRTIFATDPESSRYALGGVKIEMEADKIIGVATDGRRLAKMEGPVGIIKADSSEPPHDGTAAPDAATGTDPTRHESAQAMTIVPTRTMQLLERAIGDEDSPVRLAIRSNEILVKSPRATIYSRLIEGRFPKWRDVFPRRRDAVEIELTVGPMYGALRQAAVVTSEESRRVNFTFGGGTLILAGATADVGESHVEMPIPYDGPAIEVSLDHRYMADFLKVLPPEKTFNLEIKDSESAVVAGTDDDFSYVVMPLAQDR